MLYPNNLAAVGFIRGVTFTGRQGLFLGAQPNNRARYTQLPKTSATPSGYYAGGAWVLPYTAGLIAGVSSAELAALGNAAAGVNLSGVSAVELTVGGNAGAIAGASGAVTIAIGASAALSGIASMSGLSGASLDALGSIEGIASVTGSAVLSVNATGETSALWFMTTGELDATLTPNAIAGAVWSALAASNNKPGTMGDLLNAAGGGGISGAVIDQIADAVWEKVGSNGAEYGETLTSAEKWAKIAAALSA